MIDLRKTILAGLILSLIQLAHADNAALTTGGAPKMMDNHPSITMESEVVRLTVHWDRIETDCLFVFANSGPACKVNMGFPDFGLWAYNYPREKPVSLFWKFKSFVDGKQVPTKLVLDADKRQQWQTKIVAFPAKSRRVVREVYTTRLEGAALEVYMGAASYLLHTGSSWKNGIGKATVIVTLAPDLEIPGPLIMSFAEIDRMKSEQLTAHLKKSGGIVVNGPCKPTIQGQTLTFVRNNWKPTTKDDVFVGFKMSDAVIKKIKQAQGVKKNRGGP